MQDNFITPTPEGSARHTDYHLIPFRGSAGSFGSAASCRDGTLANVQSNASNWGLGGTDTGTLVTYLGTSMYRFRGGMQSHSVRIPWVTTRPSAITKWRDGLWVVECILAWPNDAVGADNGLIMGFVDNVANLRRSVSSNIVTVENDTAGVIRISVTGPAGTVFTNLGVSPTALTKVRVELRNATRDADGSLRVFVNDAGTPSVIVGTADANCPVKGAGVDGLFGFGIGVGSAVNYVNVADWSFWRGPDTSVGM